MENKIIVVCDRINMIMRQVALIMLLRLLTKENILIINKSSSTKLTNAVYPGYHWVISLMAYAFHMVDFSSVWCIMLEKEI